MQQEVISRPVEAIEEVKGPTKIRDDISNNASVRRGLGGSSIGR